MSETDKKNGAPGELPEEIQRWTAKRRAALVVSMLRSKTTVAEVARKHYRLRQEFTTPYTPEQNGIIERFFRTLKEECVWLHNFSDFTHAPREVMSWIHRYNSRRPHSALGYRSPADYRAQQLTKVA